MVIVGMFGQNACFIVRSGKRLLADFYILVELFRNRFKLLIRRQTREVDVVETLVDGPFITL